MQEYIVLGIDPGLLKTGWGVVSKNTASKNEIKYINCGVIKTKTNDNMEYRLSYIFDSIQSLIKEYNPDSIAMEEVFVNINPKTSEKLIMARTASFLASAKMGFIIDEYKPNEIKKNITGSGHASKDHINTIVQKILKIEIKKDNKNISEDSIDALAIALCKAFSQKF